MGRIHVIINAQTGERQEIPFSEQEELAADAAEAQQEPAVPSSITNFQARAILLIEGYLPTVEAYIATLEDPLAQAAWQYAGSVERGSALVEAVRLVLGLSEGEMDDLFIAGAAISV